MARDMTPGSLRIVVAAAYPAMREGLRALLTAQGESVWGQAATPRELLELALAHQPAVAVLDSTLEEGTIAEAARLLAAEAPEVAVLLLAEPGSEEETLEALRAGARGYLWRGATGEELAAAARAIAAGGAVLAMGEIPRAAVLSEGTAVAPRQDLTPREAEVLRLLAQGLPNKAIAQSLGITDHTVKYHIAALLAKLGAASRTEAVTTAFRKGLLAL
ncbi:MAG: response regulator transcription factor [Chloroflexi bacterium]|nr:response regulator transcription factor [Chloroflexota bacterium]